MSQGPKTQVIVPPPTYTLREVIVSAVRGGRGRLDSDSNEDVEEAIAAELADLRARLLQLGVGGHVLKDLDE